MLYHIFWSYYISCTRHNFLFQFFFILHRTEHIYSYIASNVINASCVTKDIKIPEAKPETAPKWRGRITYYVLTSLLIVRSCYNFDPNNLFSKLRIDDILLDSLNDTKKIALRILRIFGHYSKSARSLFKTKKSYFDFTYTYMPNSIFMPLNFNQAIFGKTCFLIYSKKI